MNNLQSLSRSFESGQSKNLNEQKPGVCNFGVKVPNLYCFVPTVPKIVRLMSLSQTATQRDVQITYWNG